MIKLVIGLNIAIALFGFYLAWRIWRVKRVLTSATVALTSWERSLHQALNTDNLPTSLLQTRRATALTRKRYARLLAQLQQLQRIFAIALLVMRVVQRGVKQRRILSRNR